MTSLAPAATIAAAAPVQSNPRRVKIHVHCSGGWLICFGLSELVLPLSIILPFGLSTRGKYVLLTSGSNYVLHWYMTPHIILGLFVFVAAIVVMCKTCHSGPNCVCSPKTKKLSSVTVYCSKVLIVEQGAVNPSHCGQKSCIAFVVSTVIYSVFSVIGCVAFVFTVRYWKTLGYDDDPSGFAVMITTGFLFAFDLLTVLILVCALRPWHNCDQKITDQTLLLHGLEEAREIRTYTRPQRVAT